MFETLQTLLREDRVANAPRFVWRDWVLVACIIGAMVIELVTRDDINAVVPSAILLVAIASALPWRRIHPREVGVAAMGSICVFDIVSTAAGYGPFNLYSAALVLIIMYSAFRWGSGRDMVIVSLTGFALFIVANATEFDGVADTISGFFVLEFPAVVAIAVRLTTRSRQDARDRIRLGERERLARELHDTVAHHVSAIAIQAQAGRFVAESGSLDGAAEALAVIEEEASRTLDEMRSIVGTLRDQSAPVEMAPQHGMHDIDALAAQGPPQVTVFVDEATRTVGPALGGALYRIAQEAITNARRHATDADEIVVRVTDLAGQVRLTVTDDGSRVAERAPAGYGIIGMTERATLLGGTLTAGPGPAKGWHVTATLPNERSR